jgi:hypothetical protein
MPIIFSPVYDEEVMFVKQMFCKQCRLRDGIKTVILIVFFHLLFFFSPFYLILYLSVPFTFPVSVYISVPLPPPPLSLPPLLLSFHLQNFHSQNCVFKILKDTDL